MVKKLIVIFVAGVLCACYLMHAKTITNNTTWTILVRDPETNDSTPIAPEQTATLSTGSSGKLEISSSGNNSTFTTHAQAITVLEPFKGQLTIRDEAEVCGIEEPDCCHD